MKKCGPCRRGQHGACDVGPYMPCECGHGQQGRGVTYESCVINSQGECSRWSHDHYELATRDASLGVGHIWTEVSCPAYRTLNPADCRCQ